MPGSAISDDCTVTGTSGTVVIVAPGMAAISLSPRRAVEISNRLLEAAAIANGQPAWTRDSRSA
ncbi:MAG TPA: hypothetical protein VF649_13580 [Sphingomonas sp.]|uniref:hypothetical protein n=1 Tax=Sphingomonas sp. TaxID=28214 RepID=UPI002EDB494D